MSVRSYQPADYPALLELYRQRKFFGGQFDPARDGEERLNRKIADDPEAILVAEDNGEIVGSVSIIDDGRVAWLFRFAVANNNLDVSQALHDKACEILKARGHSQVIVYSPVGDNNLDDRYQELGFNKGHDFTAYWKEL